MVAVNHIPHLVHTQTAFVWRFLALSAGESQIIHVTAWREREARSRCPSGCVPGIRASSPAYGCASLRGNNSHQLHPPPPACAQWH